MAANFRCLYRFRENCKMLKSLKLSVKHLMAVYVCKHYIYIYELYVCILCIYHIHIYNIYIFIRSICGQQLFPHLRVNQHSSDKIKILRIYMHMKVYIYIRSYIYIYIIYIYILYIIGYMYNIDI